MARVPPTNLPHADGPADTQRRLGRYAVQGTETFHRRVVLHGDRTERISGADLVILRLGQFCRTCSRLFLTQLLLRCPGGVISRICLHDEIIFLITFRNILAAGIQETLLENEQTMPERTLFEIDQPLRIERETTLTCLEMQMRAIRPSRISTQSDGLTCAYHLIFLDQLFAHVSVQSL